MDEDSRTIWCGNLSKNVTEEILYELFLQGGPIQRISLPKDSTGKQRSYAFITYKHLKSVMYALSLFEGTTLFNRRISLSNRNNVKLPTIIDSQDQLFNLDNMLQLGQQIILQDNMNLGAFQMDMQSPHMHQRKTDTHRDDRMSRRVHPYHRDYSPDRNHHKHHRSSDNYKGYRGNHYSKYDYKSNKRHAH